MNYETTTCTICGKEISTGGAANTSHYRKHVRKKEAVEYKRGKRLCFLKPDQNIIDTEPYAKLGFEQLPGQPKETWELPDLKVEFPAIDPSSYFITSGEAVRKADKCVQDLYALAGKFKSFRDKLIKARGKRKYLEIIRDGQSRSCLKAKDPRIKIEEEVEIDK